MLGKKPIFVFLALSLLLLAQGVFSASFIDTSQSDFLLGSANRVVSGADGNVVLDKPTSALYYSSGDFTSRVFDSSSTTKWNKLTFNSDLNFGPLGNGGCASQGARDVNMCGNVLLLHLNESSGALADSSGNSNNGTAYGTVTYGSTGKLGNALGFNGTDANVVVPNSSSINLTGSVTVSAWVKTGSSSSQDILWKVHDFNSTNTGGTASASSSYGQDPAAGAFDGDTVTNGWGNNNALPSWLQYDFGAGNDKIVTKYRIYRDAAQVGGWGSTAYAPYTWTFQGSSNGTDWTTLDSRTNYPAMNMGQWYDFSFSNTTAYRYYRIYVTAAVGGAWLNITEFQMQYPDNGYALQLESGKLRTFDLSNNSVTGLGSRTVNDNNWHLVSMVAASSWAAGYVDGVLDSNVAAGGTGDASSAPLAIGGSKYFLNGSLDDVAVFNRALSSAEILNIYKKGVERLKLQARFCSQLNCSDGTFAGPDNSASTYFTDINSPADLGAFSNSRYFQYKAFFETDDTNALRVSSPALLDVNVDYTQLNFPPDVNITKVNGHSVGSALPAFSFARDGNLVVDFNVLDPNNDRQRVDINYSSSTSQGTGVSIVKDFNLTLANCTGIVWNVVPVDCNYSFSLAGVSDGNYFILIRASDGELSKFNYSANSFVVDGTKPAVSWDGNLAWQRNDQNIHLSCGDGSGSGCSSVTYRLDTDPGVGVVWGAWQSYSGSIQVTSDGNFGLDFNASDSAGNVGDINEFFVLIGPHGRLHTFSSSGKPRSFFGAGGVVTLRLDANMPFAPPLSVVDSSGATVVSGASFALSARGGDYNSFDYNYSLGGAAGWYDVRVGSQYFKDAFYQGGVWGDRFTSPDGNVFPFSFDLNVSEPGAIGRWLSPVDYRADFSFGASASSVRVLDFNGTSYIEVPSQVYSPVYGGADISSANLVFLVSIARGELRNLVVSYSPASHPKAYSSDLNTTQSGFVFDFNNSIFHAVLDINKGGVVSGLSSNFGSGSDLNGAQPMFSSPQVFADPITYSASLLAAPRFSQDANGALVSKLRAGGTVGGGIDYNVVYTFYSKSPYFLVDTNLVSKQSNGSYWDYYSDSYGFFKKGIFTKFAAASGASVVTADINGNNGLQSVSDANFAAVYNARSLDAVGAVFLADGFSESSSSSVSFRDMPTYSYLRRNAYSGTVNLGDHFNSSGAVAVFNPWGGVADLNDLFVGLSSPLSAVAGGTTTDDSSAPVVIASGHFPTDANDSADVNCFSYWSDNLMIDYVDINISGPGLSVSERQSARTKDFNAVYTIPASVLNAGRVDCNFVAYDLANNFSGASASFTVSDTKAPFVYGVKNSPDSNDALDPGTTIAVDANISEYSGVFAVELLTRVFDANSGTWGDWNFVPMVNDANYSDYNFHYSAGFVTTPSVDTLWQYKIYTRDNLGNDANTPGYTIYSYSDWTWGASPASFGSVTSPIGEWRTLGVLNVVNTGDKQLNFRISSTWDAKDEISYGGSYETSQGYLFYLDANTSRSFPVSVKAKTTELWTDFNIAVSALDSQASPSQSVISAKLGSTKGGPFLLLEQADTNSNLKRGDSNILFTAKVTNLGNLDANSLLFSWALPSGWSVVYGDANSAGDLLAVSGQLENSVGVSVGSSAVLGGQSLVFSAGCCGDVNKLQVLSFPVFVSDVGGTVVVVPPAPPADVLVGPSAGGASSGGPGGIFGSVEAERTFFQSSELFELVQGRDSNFVIRIKNPFGDGNLLGLRASVSGLLSKYLSLGNPVIGDLDANEERDLVVNVVAPKYFTYGRHDLVFVITGSLRKRGSVDRDFSFENSVTLVVHELSGSDANVLFLGAVARVSELEGLGINVAGLKKILSDAKDNLDIEEYEKVRDDVVSVLSLADAGVAAQGGLRQLELDMNVAAAQGLDVPRTQRLYTLARLAFERGDFVKAGDVLKDASLTLSIETKGAFNTGFFVVQNSVSLGVGSVVLVVLLYLLLLFVQKLYLKRHLRSLEVGELLLLDLIKDAQRCCFVEKKISMNEYSTSLSQYEKRLSSNVEMVINTQNRLVNLFSFKSFVSKLKEERGRLYNEIKRAQSQYFKEGLIESRVYEAKQASLTKRLSEVEKEITYNEAVATIRKNSSPIKILWKIYYTIFK